MSDTNQAGDGSTQTVMDAAAGAGMTLTEVKDAATAANTAASPSDPVLAFLHMLENRLAAVETAVGTLSPVLGAAVPEASGILSRVSTLEGLASDFAAFATKAEPVIAGIVSELHPAG
jgi:hypothetical protein